MRYAPPPHAYDPPHSLPHLPLVSPSMLTSRVRAAQLATQVVASMLALEAIDSTSDIKLYINSPGSPPTHFHPSHFCVLPDT